MMVGNSYRVVLETLPTPPVETGGYLQATPDGVRNCDKMGPDTNPPIGE